MQILENEFQKHTNWNKAFRTELAGILGVDQQRIYKWHYNRRAKELRKNNEQTKQESVAVLNSNL